MDDQNLSLIISELREVKADIKIIENDITTIKVMMASYGTEMKLKSGFLGTIGGIIASILVSSVVYLIK